MVENVLSGVEVKTGNEVTNFKKKKPIYLEKFQNYIF